MNQPDPQLAAIRQHLQARRYAQALPLLDARIGERPQEAPLYWHRANCLEALDRAGAALDDVERVVQLQPAFAPAWLKRAELALAVREAYPAYEADVRRALALDPRLARAHRALALCLYAEQRIDEARAALAQALALDPADAEAHAIRARWHHLEAMSPADGEATVTQVSGAALSRARLEAAVDDLRRALELRPEMSQARLQLGRRLHELQRHAEAIAEYDTVLAGLAAGDARRALVERMRADSLGQGAGEREQMAQLLEQAAAPADGGAWRTSEDMIAGSVTQALAGEVRKGATAAAAFEQLISEDPDELLAVDAAQRIFNLAHQPPADYRAAPLRGFSPHQRRYAERSLRELAALGFVHIGDFEPLHLRAQLAERTLLRLYRSQGGQTVASSFSLRAPWPGWLAFLRLWLMRQWRVQGVVDLVTAFDNDGYLVTSNAGSGNPFGGGPQVQLASLPPATPLQALYQHHRQRIEQFQRQNPGAQALQPQTLEDIVALQDRLTRVRNAWRQSVDYVTEAELQALLGGHHARLAGRIRDKLRLLARAGSSAAAEASQYHA